MVYVHVAEIRYFHAQTSSARLLLQWLFGLVHWTDELHIIWMCVNVGKVYGSCIAP